MAARTPEKKAVLIDEGTLVIGEIYANNLQNNFWQPLKSQINSKTMLVSTRRSAMPLYISQFEVFTIEIS